MRGHHTSLMGTPKALLGSISKSSMRPASCHFCALCSLAPSTLHGTWNDLLWNPERAHCLLQVTASNGMRKGHMKWSLSLLSALMSAHFSLTLPSDAGDPGQGGTGENLELHLED